MKNKSVKILLTIVATLGGIAVPVVLTYPRYRREMRAAHDRLLAGSKILKTDYGDVEYTVRGEGPPVLLLHGAGGGYDQGLWYGRLSLGDGYRLISVSRYGFLRSPIPKGASIKSQATQYKALLDYLKIEKVIVVGGSAGGPSAMQFANDYPERCLALILLSAVSRSRAPGDKESFYIGIIHLIQQSDYIHLIQQSDYIYWLVTKLMQPQVLGLIGIPPKVYGDFTPEQKELAQDMLEVMNPMSQRYEGTINDGEMMERDEVSTSKISAPTLIIHAKDDALVGYAHAEHAHRRIKQSKLILFDTGGHGMLSQMDRVRGSIKEFLKGCKNKF